MTTPKSDASGSLFVSWANVFQVTIVMLVVLVSPAWGQDCRDVDHNCEIGFHCLGSPTGYQCRLPRDIPVHVDLTVESATIELYRGDGSTWDPTASRTASDGEDDIAIERLPDPAGRITLYYDQVVHLSVDLPPLEDTIQPRWGLTFDEVGLTRNPSLVLELWDVDAGELERQQSLGQVTLQLETFLAASSGATIRVPVQTDGGSIRYVGLRVVPHEGTTFMSEVFVATDVCGRAAVYLMDCMLGVCEASTDHPGCSNFALLPEVLPDWLIAGFTNNLYDEFLSPCETDAESRSHEALLMTCAEVGAVFLGVGQ